MFKHTLVSALTIGTLATASAADIIQYDFTGFVTFVSQPSPYQVQTQVGDPVQGSFFYDDTVADTSQGNPDFGSYPQLLLFDFVINNTGVISNAYEVLVSNNNGGTPFDELEVFASEGVRVDGIPQPSADMYVQFRDDTGAVFTNDSLPGPDLTLADFPDNDGANLPNGYLLDTATGQRIEFAIDSLVGIPAPATLSVGSLALVLASRRRRC